jgi:hypothetical protein
MASWRKVRGEQGGRCGEGEERDLVIERMKM